MRRLMLVTPHEARALDVARRGRLRLVPLTVAEVGVVAGIRAGHITDVGLAPEGRHRGRRVEVGR